MQRRTFLKLSAAATAGAVLPFETSAAVPKPYSYDAVPPMDNINAYVRWMQDNRGEDPKYLRPRFERFQNMVGNRYALISAPLSIVQAIGSTTTLFVFAFGIVLALLFPRISREDLSRRELAAKGVAAVLVAAGVALVTQ